MKNEALKELKNCHTLDLDFCTSLTDEGFSTFNCRVLYVRDTQISSHMINLLESRDCVVYIDRCL